MPSSILEDLNAAIIGRMREVFKAASKVGEDRLASVTFGLWPRAPSKRVFDQPWKWRLIGEGTATLTIFVAQAGVSCIPSVEARTKCAIGSNN